MLAQVDLLARRLIEWQRQHGRHDLPWQSSPEPYRVWLSEIMLQQTQVSTVMGYYQRFLERFPTVTALADASQETVMALWAGLGYYARARNLHACARAVVLQHGGVFPRTAEQLLTLPGIGPSTAAAIAAFCFGERAAILDGNVKRVLCRYVGFDADTSRSQNLQALWTMARQALPSAALIGEQPDAMSRYTQGLMDLGATVCKRTNPACDQCPLRQSCVARHENRVHELPRKNPKGARPTREVHLAWISHQNRTLLIKRPDKGIWGGLWTLPCFEDEQGVHDFIGQTFGPQLGPQYAPERMASFGHALTHFQMRLTPWRLDIDTDTLKANVRQWPEHWAWAAPNQLIDFGLPAPIKTLLWSTAPEP
jgi:A/G-specific adenine glycosylase